MAATKQSKQTKPSTRKPSNPAPAPKPTVEEEIAAGAKATADADKAKVDAIAKADQEASDRKIAEVAQEAIRRAHVLTENTAPIALHVAREQRARGEAEASKLKAAIGVAALVADGVFGEPDSYNRAEYLEWSAKPRPLFIDLDSGVLADGQDMSTCGLGLAETQAADYLSVGRFMAQASPAVAKVLNTFEAARKARIASNAHGVAAVERAAKKAGRGKTLSGKQVADMTEIAAAELAEEAKATMTKGEKAAATREANIAKAERISATVKALEGKWRDRLPGLVSKALDAESRTELVHLAIRLTCDQFDPTGNTSQAIANLQAQANEAAEAVAKAAASS